ncbi:MAG TPA: cysteine desulfurase-like protein [Streptosporangiaceae bacterium]|jgi:cysteine desulfurase family protein (TIGR01976 family)|nr:cysteine desulfurase-like protein [Streptosporangiaceae bacterium]
MSFDPVRVRAAYPALGNGLAWLDGAAGTQVPQAVIDAIAAAYTDGMANVNGVFPASHRCEEIVAAARQAFADLLGAEPDGVVLGANMTTLTYRFAATLADTWQRGDEVIVTRLDHDANVRPWVQAARRAGATVRWAEIDVASGELPAEQFGSLITDRTRLIAITAASNVLGTVPDVAAVAKAAHDVGALVYVDGVHATPHAPVDMVAIGADFYATSAYKWSGPHVSAVAASPLLLERLSPDKLAPAPDRVPDRMETGTPPFADLAGLIAAVDHLAGLSQSAAATRRERIVAAMSAVAAYEHGELEYLLTGLERVPRVRLIGRPARRTATAYFTVTGIAPRDLARYLAAHQINVWSGHAYAWEVTGALGIRDSGGAVRAGLVHYNVRGETDRLLQALADLPEPTAETSSRG